MSLNSFRSLQRGIVDLCRSKSCKDDDDKDFDYKDNLDTQSATEVQDTQHETVRLMETTESPSMRSDLRNVSTAQFLMENEFIEHFLSI